MAKKILKGFFAYPSVPSELVSTIELAAEKASSEKYLKQIFTWPQIESIGVHIADSIRNKIDECDFLIGDITSSNNNVYYEFGYAIGSGKPILPVLNASFKDASKNIQKDGFFDNIRYEVYENSDQLGEIVGLFQGFGLLEAYEKEINHEQPLFLLDTYKKTDFRNSIVSSIKASKVFYRSFDPTETPRFSTSNIIAEASASSGAIVPFLSETIVDAERHNLRASFLAGILHGLDRKVLLIQHGDAPTPADYREDIEAVKNPPEVNDIVSAFAQQAIIATQTIRRRAPKLRRQGIARLTLGASAAENEFRRLDGYFLETAEFNQALRGDGKIVAGRKGSGKTAIFFMVRDRFRADKRNLVIDLKPESHELIKLREVLSEYADAGVVSHTFTGFWQVILLNELLVKLRDELNFLSKRDHEALGLILEIDKATGAIDSPEQGDFTERLAFFVNRLIGDIEQAARKEGGKIAPGRLTNFIYNREMRNLIDLVKRLSISKKLLVLLFDNIDKGWLASGIDSQDIVLVRCLVDAANKIQRELAQSDIELRFSIFLRNDVYELLVENTSDRGKESEIKIDWSDPEKLKLMIGRRLTSALEIDKSVQEMWDLYFPKKIEGENGFNYAIRHSLMRPRFLIDILERSISISVNRGKGVVGKDDLEEAILQHSRYLVNDFGYEIRDVSGITYEILDVFLGAPKTMHIEDVENRLSTAVERPLLDTAKRLLLWYGFLGFIKDGEEKYIYDYNYIMRRLKAEIVRMGSRVEYVINPAFFTGLQ